MQQKDFSVQNLDIVQCNVLCTFVLAQQVLRYSHYGKFDKDEGVVHLLTTWNSTQIDNDCFDLLICYNKIKINIERLNKIMSNDKKSNLQKKCC